MTTTPEGQDLPTEDDDEITQPNGWSKTNENSKKEIKVVYSKFKDEETSLDGDPQAQREIKRKVRYGEKFKIDRIEILSNGTHEAHLISLEDCGEILMVDKNGGRRFGALQTLDREFIPVEIMDITITNLQNLPKGFSLHISQTIPACVYGPPPSNYRQAKVYGPPPVARNRKGKKNNKGSWLSRLFGKKLDD